MSRRFANDYCTDEEQQDAYLVIKAIQSVFGETRTLYQVRQALKYAEKILEEDAPFKPPLLNEKEGL
jgi:hypothetical protein